MYATAPTLDRINQRTYARRRTVVHYGRAVGWIDPGERAALDHVAAAMRQQPVLDIGVGGGRTVPLMQAISPDYVGIDYTPQMVEASRRRFPGVDLRVMDARSLSFPDRSVGLAAFSFNGIDSLVHEDRVTVLGEVRRVLRDDGVFVFSSLNRDGPLCPDGSAPQNLANGLRRPLRAAAVKAFGSLNRLHNQGLQTIGPDRATVNIASHAYGLVAAFISVGAERLELERAGFALEAVFASSDGARLAPGETCTRSDCLHYVARKLPSGGTADSGSGTGPAAG